MYLRKIDPNSDLDQGWNVVTMAVRGIAWPYPSSPDRFNIGLAGGEAFIGRYRLPFLALSEKRRD